MTQPFRAGDYVRVKLDLCPSVDWRVAVYEASTDTAFIAGWPCTVITHATDVLELVEACTDVEHMLMIALVTTMRGDRGDKDPRRSAIERVLANGGVP